MSKELFVSTTPHETKVAIVEDDQLAEIYFERENEYTLAGSIYKGKVTRVLPGMQSAFVDLGLERDAFLYVTDFLEEQEDVEEFDQVVTQAHERAAKGDAPAPQQAQPRPPQEPREERERQPQGGPARFERPDRGPANYEERQPLSNAATIGEAGGDLVRPEVDGNRADDRGNREGRGGRWRGRLHLRRGGRCRRRAARTDIRGSRLGTRREQHVGVDADHGLDDLGHRRGGAVDGHHDTAVAHHRDAIGDLEDLFEAMRDVDDRDPVG